MAENAERPVRVDPVGGSELLRLSVAADVLDVGLTTLRKLVRQGDLPVVKLGSVTRVRRSDLEELIKRSTTSRVA